MSKVYIVEEFDGESNSIIGAFDNEKSAEKCKNYNEILDEMGNSFYVTSHEIKDSFNEELKDIVLYYWVEFYENESRIGKSYKEIDCTETYRTCGMAEKYIDYNKEDDNFSICVGVPYNENENESDREEIAKEKGLKSLKEWEKNNE